ncbi:MAG: signal peptidase I [Chitinophagales bacterium]
MTEQTNGNTSAEDAKVRKPKSTKREIIELLIIALVIVPLINIFLLQSYAIPTSSMESEMLVGDKLFVSKIHYGPRVPMTPVALPYVHNSIFGMQSYTEAVSLPYYRLPGISTLTNNNIVVFNYPGDDPGGSQDHPVDKRTNYVKRCVAIAGDSLKIVDGEVYINGSLLERPERSQFMYRVVLDSPAGLSKRVKKELGIREIQSDGSNSGIYAMHLTDKAAEELKKMKIVVDIEKIIHPKGRIIEGRIFGNDTTKNWNRDNYGPIYLPKAGGKVKITPENHTLYDKAIKVYENNPSYKFENGQAYMNGSPIEDYEFKMNYYFMMGDNRHHSLDSRYWGFVPEDHIVGKPVFVWLSTESNGTWSEWIRWDKSFRTVH